MENLAFSCDVEITQPNAGLTLSVLVDNSTVAHISETGKLSCEFAVSEGQHFLKLELSGKQPHHTKLDKFGDIESDVLLTVKNIQINDIDLDQIIQESSRYVHDFNNTQPPASVPFYGVMGCNGTVEWLFEAPFYVWLLDRI